ncbi:MAG: DUF4238 domain-containing protein [Opitutaceae bacterium]|nr:DUF4238 domain-containing protein [Opitutaceae bacterium]
MALDHYVPQVHLKNFNNSDGVLHAMLKRDQKTFTNHAKAFCRIEDNSTNKYLTEQRAIEDFLQVIEPKYNESIEKIRTGSIDPETVFVVSGFIAYMMWFSPAGMRINKDPMEHTLDEVGRRLDAQGKMPRAPTSMGGVSLTEMLDKGEARINVDPKYPQAIGVTILQRQIYSLGNFNWEILKNPFPDSPFFTSDYPVAIEPSDHPGILNKVVPLAPDLAVRICPKQLDNGKITDNFASFRYRTPTLNHRDVVEINRLIVRCAETIVFYPKEQPWIAKFVKANADFRIEPKSTNIPYGAGGTLQISTSIVTDE